MEAQKELKTHCLKQCKEIPEIQRREDAAAEDFFFNLEGIKIYVN